MFVTHIAILKFENVSARILLPHLSPQPTFRTPHLHSEADLRGWNDPPTALLPNLGGAGHANESRKSTCLLGSTC